MIRRGIHPGGAGVPPPPGWHPGRMSPPPPNMAGNVPPPGPAYHPDFDNAYAQRQLRRGIQVACIGLALLIGLGTIGDHHYGPWLLGGLVPLFVGIGQIVNAYLNGARFPMGARYGGGQTTFGPPPGVPPGGPAAPPPAGNGPYGWRPGPTPEIERPVNPPDQRR